MKKNVTLLVLSFFLCFGIHTFAQVSQGGEPFSFKGKLPTFFDDNSVNTAVMPTLNMKQIEAEDDLDATNGDLRRISRYHNVALNIANSGTWETLPNGDRVWRLRIVSAGALAMHLNFDEFFMPAGARMFVYNGDRTHYLGSFTSFNNKSWGGFATGVTEGDVCIVEYYEPNAVAGQGRISINQVAHAYRDIHPENNTQRGGDPCQVDINCVPEGDNWQDEKKGACRILVQSGQGSGWCSGSLINNTDQDCKAYVLTAFHCGENSTTTHFNNYVFYWNYEAAVCGGSATANQSITGCVKRADSNDGGGNSGSDFLLVEMDGATDVQTLNGWGAYWNGWDANNSASPNGVSIHHPAGAKKKVSTYTSSLSSTTWGGTPNTHWLVYWAATANGHGVTEGGSSGSPIFTSTGLICGQLTGGASYCTATGNPDRYGKMSYNWQSNPTTTHLKDWLDPGNTGLLTLQGTYYPCTPAVSDDAGITVIVDPADGSNLCNATSITPVVTLRNWGSNTLTSVTINYSLDGGPNQTFAWTGSLASGATTNVTLPSMAVGAGAHTFDASTSNPNGNTDGNTGNDAASQTSFTVASGALAVLTINTDCWGYETYWEILNQGTATVVASGGNTSGIPPGGGQGAQDTDPGAYGNEATITENLCLAVGCYDFVIYDDYGDGMYGSQYGTCTTDGSYTIEDDQANVLASIQAANSDFGNSETNQFCLTAGCPTITANASSTNASCNGVCDGSVTASASGGQAPYTYSWDGGLGGGGTHNNVCAGTYTVTITDDNGCTGTGTVTVTEPAAINVNTSSTNASCNGVCDGSVTVTASGGTAPYTYSWSGGLGGGATHNNVCAGSYTVTITDANGCTATGSATVTEPAALSGSASSTDASCNGSCDGSVSATASGGTAPYTYSWTGGLGGGGTHNNVCTGSYTVTITDANGCTATASATVNEPTALSASAASTDATCNGVCDGSVTGTATGGTAPYAYNWSGGLGGGASHNNVCAGTYTLTVTDVNGCTATANVTVSEPAGMTLTTSGTDATCGNADGEACVTVSGGNPPYTYLWSPGGATTACASNIAAGSYTVTVTDANGCTDQATVNVSNIGGPSVTGTTTDEIFGNDGSVDITVTGGTSPYTYLWSPGGATTEDISGLQTGSYSVTVTDANGCSTSETFFVGTQVGISSNNIDEVINVYPNPTSGMLTVEFSATDLKDVRVDVYNTIGELVNRVTPVDGTTRLEMDLTSKAEGLYYVNIYVKEAMTTKIISVVR